MSWKTTVCYLRCYIINMLTLQEGYDTIGLQSLFFDDIFRYKYNYIDMVRAGINLAVEPKDIYNVSFSMDNSQYELSFCMGHDNRLGLLEDFDKKGELLIPLYTNKIQECYNISKILYRFVMFMTSKAEVPFKQITLYKNRKTVGRFYCSLVSEEAISVYDISYCEFDVYYEFEHLNIKHRIAIECKDWSKPVTIGEIRDFSAKLDDLNNISGVMVSKSGYQAGAKQYAQEKGIQLMEEKDLPTFTDIVAGVIKKAFLPDKSVEGRPFWTLMEVQNGEIQAHIMLGQIGRNQRFHYFIQK